MRGSASRIDLGPPPVALLDDNTLIIASDNLVQHGFPSETIDSPNEDRRGRWVDPGPGGNLWERHYRSSGQETS